MNRNYIIFLILGLAVLIGLFYIIRPKSNIQISQINPSTATSSAQTTNTKTFDLVVKGKKIASGSGDLKVTEGDQITINITNDEDEELHLHGYDKSVELQANKPASLSFTANLTGRFPFELEHSKVELGALEVQPK